MRVEVRLLGPVEVRVDGEPVDLGPPKRRVILARLVVSHGHAVPVESLVDEVWGADPPASARTNLRGHVAALRTAVPSPERWRLVSTAEAYVLHTVDVDIDAERFTEFAGAGRAALAAGDVAGAVRLFERALALWRGRCAEDVPRGPHLMVAFDALDEQRLAVQEELTGARLAAGDDPDELVPTLRALVAEHPLRERLWEYLMLALYRSGDPAGALAAFTSARAALDEGLGLEPGEDLRRMQRRVLERDPALGPEPDPAAPQPIPAPPRVVPRELPAVPAVFIGRDAELSAVDDALRRGGRPAIVAIHGPGGVGKSAVAITAAHRYADRYPDGQLYLDLQGSTPGLRPLEPREALARLLRSLGVAQPAVPISAGEAAALYRSRLAGRRVLVLADNAAAVDQIEPLVPGDAGCAVVVTSRRILGELDGAAHIPLTGLAERDSIRLLEELTGRRAGAGAGPDDEPSAVARHLGGLPLALRIAGARLLSRADWTYADLAHRLADRSRLLDELDTGSRAVRHSLEVSYAELVDSKDPLDGSAADTLRAIGSVQVVTFSPALVAAITGTPVGDAQTALDRLVDARLVDGRSVDGRSVNGRSADSVEDGPVPATSRYALHDLVRLFAADLATRVDPPQVRDRRLRLGLSWYALHARRSSEYMRPGVAIQPPVAGAYPVPVDLDSIDDATRWLDAEHANAVEIVRQAVEHPGPHLTLVLHLAVSFFPSLLIRSYARDWETLCDLVLGAVTATDDRLAVIRLRMYLAQLYRNERRLDAATHCLEAARRLQRDDDPIALRALAIELLAMVHVSSGRLDDAIRSYEDAVRLREEGGDPMTLGSTLSNAAEAYFLLGRHDEALRMLTRSLELRLANDDMTGAVTALTNLAEVHLALGQHARALDHIAEVTRLNRAGADRESQRRAESLRARIQLATGRLDDVARTLDLVHRLAESGHGLTDTGDLRSLYAALVDSGQPEMAERMLRRLTAAGVPEPLVRG